MPVNVKIVIPIVVVVIVVIASLFILLQQQQQVQEQEVTEPITPTPRTPTPTPTPTAPTRIYVLRESPHPYKVRDPYDEDRARYPDIYKAIDVKIIVQRFNLSVPLSVMRVVVIDLNNKTVLDRVIAVGGEVYEIEFTIPLTKEEFDNLFKERTMARLNLAITLMVGGEVKMETLSILVEIAEETPTWTPPWGGGPQPT